MNQVVKELNRIIDIILVASKVTDVREEVRSDGVVVPRSNLNVTRIISMHYSQNIKDLTFMMRQMDEMVKRNN